MSMRTIASLGLLYVAFFGLPEIDLPTLPQPSAPEIKEPSVSMQKAVSAVADICEEMDAFDRLVWMATWNKAAEVIDGESDVMEVEFTSTLGLQVWQQSIFDIAWRRLAKASGKYKGLSEAVEQAFADTIGLEIKPVDKELLNDVAELYRALAWAGARSE